MFLAIGIACGVAVLAVLVWRLRAASATLHAILAEPSEPAAEPAEPSTIAWPHPPRRLWAER